MDLRQEMQEDYQHNILSRLSKIEGQIRGLQAMVREGKECEPILIQLRAAQSALKSVSTLVLKSYLLKCYEKATVNCSPEEMFQRLEKTVVMLTKLIGK